MRLFYQLSESDKNNALHYCADIVVEDLISDGVKLEPVTNEDIALKEKLDNAIEHIKLLSTNDEKISYLMSDIEVSKTIYEIALEMAKSAFYHDDEEMIIYPNSLKSKELEESEDTTDITEPISLKPKKTPHSLN